MQHAVKLRGGRTMELCVTKWWANLGEAMVRIEVAFRGTVPIPTALNIVGFPLFFSLDVLFLLILCIFILHECFYFIYLVILRISLSKNLTLFST